MGFSSHYLFSRATDGRHLNAGHDSVLMCQWRKWKATEEGKGGGESGERGQRDKDGDKMR